MAGSTWTELQHDGSMLYLAMDRFSMTRDFVGLSFFSFFELIVRGLCEIAELRRATAAFMSAYLRACFTFHILYPYVTWQRALFHRPRERSWTKRKSSVAAQKIISTRAKASFA